MHRLLTVPLLVFVSLAVGSAQGAGPALPGKLVYSSDRGPNVHNAEIYALSVSRPVLRDLSQSQGPDGGPSPSRDGRWVAFWSERLVHDVVVRGLYVMRADGSQKRLLTPPALSVDGQTPASWSPDSRELAFTAADAQRAGLWIVRRDGTGLRLLVEYGRQPEWAPRGRRIAYSAPQGERSVVETIDVDSGKRTTLADGGAPTWAPDGRSIAYTYRDERTKATDVFVVGSDGGQPAQLTHVDPGTWAYRPSWAPNGRRILFTLAAHLWTVRSDTGRVTKLRLGHEGAWSPNGAQIAFLVGRGISVMRANGSGARSIRARVPGFTWDAPTWTRDGTRLLVQAIADRAQYDLFTSNADGSRLRRLTHTKQDEILPAWSPNGRRIAFVRGRLRDQSIWVSSSSATNLKRLHDGTYPSWSPSGKRLAFEDDGIVYTMSDSGRDVRPFASGAMPAWSPDGRQIALVRGPALFVADAETRQRRTTVVRPCCSSRPGHRIPGRSGSRGSATTAGGAKATRG
jgi:Tol biopolymer transport system component